MLIGILIALALFMYLAMRGVSVILASLICTLIVVVSNGLSLDTAILKHFATGPLGAFSFAGKFFLLFVAGAVFGKMMSASGAANNIAFNLVDIMGARRAVLITVLFSALLTYGGVVLFVVIFTMYPIGVQLLSNANIPKRLFTAGLALGVGTFTMTAMPGAPSIHNVIASVSLKTDLFAAAGYGLFASAIMLGLGLWYLAREQKKAEASGEGFEPNQKDQQILAQHSEQHKSHVLLSYLPLIIVLFSIMAPRFLSMAGVEASIISYAKSQPIIWPCISLFIGALSVLMLFPKTRENSLVTLGQGAEDAIMPLIATSVVIGFGGVVSQTSVFSNFVQWVSSLDIPLLWSVFISISAVSAIVGSSSGGLQIFMGSLAPIYLEKGADPEVLHRVAAMASGGFDSLPHSGAVVALLIITGLTHKKGYKDIGVVTVLIPVVATTLTILLAQ